MQREQLNALPDATIETLSSSDDESRFVQSNYAYFPDKTKKPHTKIERMETR